MGGKRRRSFGQKESLKKSTEVKEEVEGMQDEEEDSDTDFL